MFGAEINYAARMHAIEDAPNECCGIVAGGEYIKLPNLAENPGEHVKPPVDFQTAYGDLQAFVHSHIRQHGHGFEPSAHDMDRQEQMAIPWGIVLTDGKAAYGPEWFGAHILDEPLVGRVFLHGVRDCYELMRASWWQKHQVKLPVFPRENNWWKPSDGSKPRDLIRESFAAGGFVEIPVSQAEPGDVLLMEVASRGVVNHCAELLPFGRILHHPGGLQSLSRIESLGTWAQRIRMACRYAP
jgi:cell wall-associated NlpC family hydrolase